MKLMKTIGFLVIFAMLCSTASAATENKELPSKVEVYDFIDDLKGADDVYSIYDDFIEQYPAGHSDVLNKDLMALYYYAPYSTHGYRSIYINSNGKIVKPECDGDKTPEKSYKGEGKSESDGREENEGYVDEDENGGSVNEDKVKENDREENDRKESGNTYKKLNKLLKKYDGTTTCQSEKCANELSDWINDQDSGWNADVSKKTFNSLAEYKTRYCVEIETTDEGVVYIILG